MVPLFYKFCFILFIYTLGYCKRPFDKREGSKNYEQYSGYGIRIAWDYSSMQQLAEQGGYPRLSRLKDSALIAIFETYTGNIHLRKSPDNGNSWSQPIEVFSQFTQSNDAGQSTLVRMSNPEIIQLQNGDLVIACNYRPQQEEIAPFSIVIRRSKDNGTTWQPPQILYSASPRFIDGCWEPSFLQLPDGELQVYFANENPYQHSSEQEISMLRSFDNGITWTKDVVTVSFRHDRRDGMPVPIITNDEIVVAIEDNKQGQFKPYTVRTKLENDWTQPVLAKSVQREYALSDKISDNVYMGAPYLLKLPTGQTLLSYQTTENRSTDWELSTMEVAIGDASARKFKNRTRPFEVPLNKEAKWNSLAVWDNRTVVAFASTNFKSANVSPWLIKGYILSDTIDLTKNTSDNSLFVGAKYQSNLNADFSKYDNIIKVECKINDPDITPGSENGVYFYYQLKDQKFKVWATASGSTQYYKWESSKWVQTENTVKTEVEKKNSTYEITFDIPVGKESGMIKTGLALKSNGPVDSYTEFLSGMNEDDPGSWITVMF